VALLLLLAIPARADDELLPVIDGVASGRYERSVSPRIAVAVHGSAAAAFPAEMTSSQAAQCTVTGGTRFVIEKSLRPGPGGAIQRGGLRAFVSSQPQRVWLAVLDSCDRNGTAGHVVTP
jgi:hypothetical protein